MFVPLQTEAVVQVSLALLEHLLGQRQLLILCTCVYMVPPKTHKAASGKFAQVQLTKSG